MSAEEMARRKAAWVAPPYKYTRGTMYRRANSALTLTLTLTPTLTLTLTLTMYRYIKTVSSAQKGCVTDE